MDNCKTACMQRFSFFPLKMLQTKNVLPKDNHEPCCRLMNSFWEDDIFIDMLTC